MSSSRLRRTSYLMKSIADPGGRPSRGEEAVASGPTKSVRTCKVIAGIAYGQNIFDQSAPNILVLTKGSATAQKSPVYPGADVIAGSLFCLFDKEYFESNSS